MKKHFLFFLIAVFSFQLIAQENKLQLKSGDILLDFDLQVNTNINLNYCFMSFNAIPTAEIKSKIEGEGIQILEYIPKNTFVVSIPKNTNTADLAIYGVSAVSLIKGVHKIDPKIQNNTFPDWSINNGKLSVKVLLYKNADISITQELFKSSAHKVVDVNVFSNSITLEIDPSALSALANINDVWYIEPIDPPSVKENKTGRTLHRSNTINTNYASGRHYNGEGINIMMQDDGLVGPHIDRQGRVDQSFCVGCSSSSSNDHGDHVSGTIMGAGNLDPLGKGMADGAFLYVYSSSNNNYYDVPTIYQNNDVIITSKSYSNGCNAGYTSLAKDLDEQINLYPSLIHVFSAGNNGNSDCGYGAGNGWGNVTGGHKQAKNVIATANLTEVGGLASSSSRGPAADGRIKPDIGAKGTSVYSPVSPYTYDTYTGTSMACPGIAGIMAQLYQAYKELNNQNPPSALMKCILLNSADDIGNPGPDFKHGWGEANVFKAVKILEANDYLTDSVSQGDNRTHSISIPAGIKQVKVMTYWHDKEASTNASIALVNNLNTYITDPNGLVYDPWVLDATPNSSNLDQNAVRGIDDLNNMEQVTIDNPTAGTYILSVYGFTIPFGPQEYYVTYELIDEDVTLTYPIGGEGFVPGETELLRWDASNGNTPFTLEYTTDGGVLWNTITTSAGVNSSYYSWTVPNTITNEAKVRVSRNGFMDESDADFTIVGVPQNVTVNWICPDSIYVLWNTVNGATEYEVSMLGNVYMDSMTTTNNLTALIVNPNPSITDSWFSACAKVNGKKGRRAVAINAQPINNGCIAPPVADFTTNGSSSCSGNVSFIDASLNQPNTWQWDFGDGTTSNLQNPIHTYLQAGTYDVSLFVSNGLGQDSILISAVVTINFMPAPIAYNDTSYVNPAIFSLTTATNLVNWYIDTLGSASIYFGSPFTTPLLSTNTTYYAREIGGLLIYGGPLDNTMGGGGFYNNDRHLFIDCFTSSKLVSADVYAGTVQAITFELRDNSSQVIADTTITVQIGLNTLILNFDMPIMNNLELGMSSGNSNLYRNNSGAAYPYAIGTLASITGHNSPNSAGYHYFFYNLQMQENCLSDYAEATAVFMVPSDVKNITEKQFSISPNPATSFINISTDATIERINIFDVRGGLVFSKPYSVSSTSVDISKFAKGIYAVQLISQEISSVQQLIIE
ncbi:MAG TPA: PKD domain-containing protein [Flavobacteriales bacterium]|nr:PKD domain-containing protein [Flavobacteriales bacterium]